MSFPQDFVWGAATSSYQIEGASAPGERGPSVWDTFCRREGAIEDASSGAIACDHVGRLEEDIDILRWMGVRAYRFSISWPRVLPAGTGEANEAGLDVYDRLVDGLLEAGITPWATLFHWDLPQALEDAGGWRSPDSPAWFAEYTRLIVDRLSDRVAHWMTLNEPQVFLQMGHATGEHAPGLRLPLDEQLRAAHHVLVAHGRSVREIRERAKRTPSIGVVSVGHAAYPAANGPEHVAAANDAMFTIREPNFWNMPWFLDPVCRGAYPAEGLALYGDAMPAEHERDMATIAEPIDFVGLNIYTGQPTRAGAAGPEAVPLPPGHPRTAFGWAVTPEALHWCPRLTSERYGLPIYITENGLANLDWVASDGRVHDPQRIDYTRRYLLALHDAIEAGADIRGYFHWSLLDNFEWARGYTLRFGLVHVDFETGERRPKDAAHWYRSVCRSGGSTLFDRAAPPELEAPIKVVLGRERAGTVR